MDGRHSARERRAQDPAYTSTRPPPSRVVGDPVRADNAHSAGDVHPCRWCCPCRRIVANASCTVHRITHRSTRLVGRRAARRVVRRVARCACVARASRASRTHIVRIGADEFCGVAVRLQVDQPRRNCLFDKGILCCERRRGGARPRCVLNDGIERDGVAY